MRNRLLLAGGLGAVLVAAVAVALYQNQVLSDRLETYMAEAEPPPDQPAPDAGDWMVTGTDFQLGDGFLQWEVRYRSPAGMNNWQVRLGPSASRERINKNHSCFTQVQIGGAAPRMRAAQSSQP